MQAVSAQQRQTGEINARLWARISIASAMLIVAALVWTLLATSDQALTGVGGEDGKLGGDFTLQSAAGDVSLSDHRGRVVVIYFGFLNCHEVCLNSMRVMQNTLLNLNDDEVDQVRMMLISIDPARDTKEDLARFAAVFHPNMLGLTGSQEEIDAVAREYGATFELTEEERNDPNYLFRHSSRYYVIDQQGELVDAMRHSTTTNEILARVRQVLGGGNENQNNEISND